MNGIVTNHFFRIIIFSNRNQDQLSNDASFRTHPAALNSRVFPLLDFQLMTDVTAAAATGAAMQAEQAGQCIADECILHPAVCRI
jgi:hypothetical protein